MSVVFPLILLGLAVVAGCAAPGDQPTYGNRPVQGPPGARPIVSPPVTGNNTSNTTPAAPGQPNGSGGAGGGGATPPAPIGDRRGALQNGFADLNDDKFVDQSDADLFRDILKNNAKPPNLEFMLKRMDLNGDGKVNHLDLLIVREFIDGAFETLPVPRVYFGDLDQNVTLDVADLNLIHQVIADPHRAEPVRRVVSDLNEDDTYSSIDEQILKYHIKGVFPSLPQRIFLADYNSDKIVDARDYEESKAFFESGVSYDFFKGDLDLPEAEIKKLLVLDLNSNGKVGKEVDPFDQIILVDFLKKKIANVPAFYSFGDVDGDGTITQKDYQVADQLFKGSQVIKFDAQLLALNVVKDYDDNGVEMEQVVINQLDLSFIKRASEAEDRTMFEAGQITCRYGDLNEDLVVDSQDHDLLEGYVANIVSPKTDCQRYGSDVNADGIINEKDTELLDKKIKKLLPNGNHFDTELPPSHIR